MKFQYALAASALAFSSVNAFAQTAPAGVPAERSTNQNAQPGPAAADPSEPTAPNNPAARAPTSPPGAGAAAPAAPDSGASSGASTGESGLDSPAGIPVDPYTNENRQPGPSTQNPSDPAAGANPAARTSTAPEKQQ